jgi:anaerobic selenocysteine-containing dehydrogenase
VLAAKDPEWFEKIESISPADIIAVATEFTKQTVDKIQHGELQQMMPSTGCCIF